MTNVLQNITYTTQLDKLDTSGKVGRICFTVSINGVSFEYSMGHGHAKPIASIKKTGKPYVVVNLPEHMYPQQLRKPGSVLPTMACPKPTLEDVLYCLFNDASALETCFEDWACEYGYDIDSRKALAIYQACVDNGLKLRSALGKDYHTVKEYVDSLEL